MSLNKYAEIKGTYAIKIGSRFFYGFGKKKQVMTAWCLAGAKLFQGCLPEVYDLFDVLQAKGKKPVLVRVTFEGEVLK